MKVNSSPPDNFVLNVGIVGRDPSIALATPLAGSASTVISPSS
jgi:hypothetical protein